MAVSLEAREPLLDHKLLEFAATVPDVAQAEERPRASTCCAGCSSGASRSRSSIGRSTASRRRSASGCAVRWRRWWTRCCSTAGCAIAASSTIARSPGCGASIATARADHRHRLWSLVMLELWFRQFVDGARHARAGSARRGRGGLTCAASPESSSSIGSTRTRRRARVAHARRHHASRARRSGAALRRARRARPSPPEHRRPGTRPAAAVERRRQRLGRLQRRDLQPRATSARELEAHGHRYRTQVRHRDDRARLRAMGRRLRAALPRHVRVRDLGRAAAAAAARARSPRHQAALLGARGRPRCSSARRSRRSSRAASIEPSAERRPRCRSC